ncbi:MAG: glycosyltransferase family 1 protein [Candidatus Beckwithbacteria bacterium]
MLIGIDANEANVVNRVGSNQYAFQILTQLSRLDKTNSYRIYLKTAPLSDMPSASLRWQYQIVLPKFLWTQWRLPLQLYFQKPKPDLFLTLGHYAPRFSPVPTLVCIMDLAFLKFPQTFRRSDLWQLKLWTAYSTKQAKHIFAISQATKNDLVASYQIPENKISVVYPGVDRLKVTGKSPVKGKYLLYVGTLQPRKNLNALIEVFCQSARSDLAGIKLVIAGKTGWLYQPRPLKNVQYLGFVPQDKLPTLIKNSLGLILPSLYEGFGIPVVQAMALGTPVLVSRNSSLPEIVGDCGLYIEPPFNAPAIEKGIIELLSLSTETKKQQLAAARQKAKNFSWEKSANTILEVLNELTL